MTGFEIYLISIMVILTIIFAIILGISLFTEKRKIARDIIENVNETVVIYDKSGNPSFTRLLSEDGNVHSFLQEMEREVNQSGVIPPNFAELAIQDITPTIYTGRIKIRNEQPGIYSWKMSPIIRNSKYYGRVFVFTDITQYMELMEQTEMENERLARLLEEQRKYVDLAKKLETEKEYERIMSIVNSISEQYLKQLDESIQTMGRYATGSSNEEMENFITENSRMVTVTRDTIAEIRGTVQKLHVSG